MSRYAQDTTVTSEKSRVGIESTLRRYGADQFMYDWEAERAVIGFRMEGRQVRFVLPTPDRNDPTFTHTPAKRIKRSDAEAEKAWEQGCRQAWRALALVVKAKLEAVEAAITVFDDEFLAHIVLPDGTSAGGWMRPQIEEVYRSGAMPAMLPALGAGT